LNGHRASTKAFSTKVDYYAYVLNNPVKYNDPSGHWYYDPGCDCLVATGNPGNEDPDNLTYENAAGSVSALELAFDPYYGTYVDDLQSGAVDEEALNNVDEVWNAAAIAYDVAGVNLDEIAANVEVNPLSSSDVAERLYGDGSIDHMLFLQAAHEPFTIFLQVLGEKHQVDLMPSSNGYMQLEANYLAALMNAHPVELAEAMVIYKEKYGDPRIITSQEDLENIVKRIRFRYGGGEG
jgi:hypothetical protein